MEILKYCPGNDFLFMSILFSLWGNVNNKNEASLLDRLQMCHFTGIEDGQAPGVIPASSLPRCTKDILWLLYLFHLHVVSNVFKVKRAEAIYIQAY